MNIDINDIISHADSFTNQMIMTKLKNDGKFSVYNLDRLKSSNIFDTEYAYFTALNLIVGAIDSYHSQLRNQLIEIANIDIGEINF